MIEGCRLLFFIQPAPWCQEGFSFVLCLTVLRFTSRMFSLFFWRRLLWHRCGDISNFFLWCLDFPFGNRFAVCLLYTHFQLSWIEILFEFSLFLYTKKKSTKKHQRANFSFKYFFCIICLSSSPAKHTHKPSTRNAIFVFLIGHLRNSGPYINTTGG